MNLLTKVLMPACLLFSLNCYAEKVPLLMLDQEVCQVKGWHNLGGCFNNKTGADLKNSGLYLREYIFYSDKRSPLVGTFPIEKLRAERYVVISTSSKVISTNHIKRVTVELATNGSTSGGSVPGCRFELQGENTLQKLVLVKSGNDFNCT